MDGQGKYEVKVSREGQWWVAEVADLRGGATETRRLADLEVEVRDLIAGLLDVDDDSFDLTWDMSAVLGPEGEAKWRAFLTERDELNARQRRFEKDRLETLRALHGAGLSIRDTATLVDLSHQRVAQLLDA